MENLQELFDAYLLTKPSGEKIRAATIMMIHVGKALNVATQEEITHEYYDEITGAIDDFFIKSPQKATLDKVILAEMIGRVGPSGKSKRIFKKLLEDRDENVRQYALASLEFFGQKRPKTVLKYIEIYGKSVDENMRMIATDLAAKMLCHGKHRTVLAQFQKWCGEDKGVFAVDIIRRIKDLNENDMCGEGFDRLHKWSMEHYKDLWENAFMSDEASA